MQPLNIVFAGTPEFAAPTLEALLTAGHRIAAVYTQPDRPAGRGQRLHMSAIKERALQHGLTVNQPASLRSPDALAELAALNPDVMIVVAYGLILPAEVLAIPRLGCLNVHGSLLPRWRGAAPIQRAILAGDAHTGISIMQMDAELDTGPVLSHASTPIGAHENAAQLHDRLAMLGAQALIDALPRYAAGELQPTPQPQEGATYAAKLRKAEARLDWRMSARDLDLRIRAFNPWPVAETQWQGQQMRIWEALPAPTAPAGPPGAIVSANASGILVVAGEGALNLQRVQLAGRKAMSAGEFVNAHRLDGARLE